MALKAGRVGVHPSQVDLFGMIQGGGSGDSYTKAEADAKFETQTHAAQLQPITLAVPIHMLNGTVLTVEGMFAGDQDALTNKELTDSLDGWTSASLVQSDNTVTFTGLDDSYGYDLYYDVPLGDSDYTYSKVTKTGSGTSISLTFATNAPNGTSCKLRIIK